jgi:hypothetical protein
MAARPYFRYLPFNFKRSPTSRHPPRLAANVPAEGGYPGGSRRPENRPCSPKVRPIGCLGYFPKPVRLRTRGMGSVRGSSSGVSMVKQQIGRCIILLFGLALGGPAGAQALFPYGGYSSALPPHEVMAIVRSSGLEPVGRPQRQGQTYGIRAVNRSGQEVRVIVDARMGRILKVVPLPPDAAAAPLDRPPGTVVPDGYGPNSRLGAVPPPPLPYGPAVTGPGAEPDGPPSSGATRSPKIGAAPAPRPKPKSEQPSVIASGDDKARLAAPPLSPTGDAAAPPPADFEE